jgi:hypothetical protein
MPVWAYDKDRLANPGRNYWDSNPIFGITYLTQGGFNASAQFMCDITTKDTDTGFLSGQEFHSDYVVGRRFGDFMPGVTGCMYQQTTDDKLHGERAFAIRGRSEASREFADEKLRNNRFPLN